MITIMSVSSSPTADTCYSWIVLLACSFIRMLQDGFWQSFGIFFVTWEEQFDSKASTLAWIGVSLIPIVLLIAPVASALSHKLSYRAVVIIAGIVTFVAVFGMSLAKELWHINLIMVMCGLGLGLAFQPACTFYVFYFQHYFAFAYGINSACSGAGTLIMPPLVELLVNYYGWRDALLFMSAVMANICVCGALMVPPDFELSQKYQHQKDSGGKEFRGDENEKAPSFLSYDSGNVRTMLNENTDDTASIQLETYTSPNKSHNNTSTYLKLTNTKVENGFSNVSPEYCDDPQSVTSKGHCGCCKAIYKDLDLSLFRKVRFIFHGVLTPLLYSTLYPTLLYFIPCCVEAGISTFYASLLMSVIGVCVTVTRASPLGWMVDKKIISASTIGGLAAIAGGIVITMLPFAKTYSAFMIIGCLYAVTFLGVAGSLYMFLIKESAGSTDKVPGAIAWANLSSGIGSVPAILLAGFLRDLTQSYVASYSILGAFTICVGVIMLSDPCLAKWQHRLDHEGSHTMDTEKCEETNKSEEGQCASDLQIT